VLKLKSFLPWDYPLPLFTPITITRGLHTHSASTTSISSPSIILRPNLLPFPSTITPVPPSLPPPYLPIYLPTYLPN
jgi:hypothetical protein